MKKVILMALVAVLVNTIAANAGIISDTTGFTFKITGSTTSLSDYNSPILYVVNDSTSADITRFVFTIGDVSKNFDAIETFVTTVTGLTYTVSSPDEYASGGVRSDILDIVLGGTMLTPGSEFSCKVNVDPDSYNAVVNTRTIFFNNGDLPNSVATAYFSDGKVLSVTLPDFTSSPYVVSASVPEPATMLLLGLGGMLFARRKK